MWCSLSPLPCLKTCSVEASRNHSHCVAHRRHPRGHMFPAPGRLVGTEADLPMAQSCALMCQRVFESSTHDDEEEDDDESDSDVSETSEASSAESQAAAPSNQPSNNSAAASNNSASAASSARASSSARTTSRSSSNTSAYRPRVVSATVESPRRAIRLSLPKRRANPAPRRMAPILGLDAVNGRGSWLRQGQRCALGRPRPEFFAPLLFQPVWLSRSPEGFYCRWAGRSVRAGGQYPKLLGLRPEVFHDG